MEGRLTRKYGFGSPERLRVRLESKAPQQRSQPQSQQLLQPGTKVPVVYYLCRDRHLEHPHFVEVPVSSQEGLFLRDVINRLNALRGKRMASSYSWSCKRSYKSGFVWHDISEDDMIVPTNGNEYILKGTELFDSSTSDGCHHPNGTAAVATTTKLLSPRQEPLSGHESPSSSSRIVIRGPNQLSALAPPSVQEDELSPSIRRTSSSSGNTSNSSLGSDGSPRLVGCKVYKPTKGTDAATQTEEKGSSAERRAQGNVAIVNHEVAGSSQNPELRSKESAPACSEEISPAPTSSSTPASNGKVETLESLIRAEARKMNRFRILEEDDVLSSSGSKFKATNVIMQLITCGSLSVKDHQSFGLVHSYKPRFSHVNFPSPVSSSPIMLGERDIISDTRKTSGLRLEEKCSSGSMHEAKIQASDEGKVAPILPHCASLEADRNNKLADRTADKLRMVSLSRSKGLQRTMKLTSGRQVKSEAMRSPGLDDRRTSFSASRDCSFSTTSVSINGSSMRSADAYSDEGPSSRLGSFKDNQNILKIEERLPSGARIIIQSRSPCDDRLGCSSTSFSCD